MYARLDYFLILHVKLYCVRLDVIEFGVGWTRLPNVRVSLVDFGEDWTWLRKMFDQINLRFVTLY